MTFFLAIDLATIANAFWEIDLATIGPRHNCQRAMRLPEADEFDTPGIDRVAALRLAVVDCVNAYDRSDGSRNRL